MGNGGNETLSLPRAKLNLTRLVGNGGNEKASKRCQVLNIHSKIEKARDLPSFGKQQVYGSVPFSLVQVGPTYCSVPFSPAPGYGGTHSLSRVLCDGDSLIKPVMGSFSFEYVVIVTLSFGYVVTGTYPLSTMVAR